MEFVPHGMAPSPPGIAQRFGGILLRELGAAACNRAVLGRSQFCGRACTEVATFLLARELLPVFALEFIREQTNTTLYLRTRQGGIFFTF
mgnify:CR=1 FL=1